LQRQAQSRIVSINSLRQSELMISKNVETLNYRFQLASAKEAVRGVASSCKRPIMTTKFNQDSAVILHFVQQIIPGIPVIWVDTGYNSQETLQFVEELTAKLQLSLHTYSPLDHEIRTPPEYGSDDHESFVNEVKIEPFERAMKELNADAWFSSIRRYQSTFRFEHTMFELLSSGVLKTSPLLEWSAETVDRYIDENKLPRGPECFDPTKGEQTYQECGLHYDRA